MSEFPLPATDSELSPASGRSTDDDLRSRLLRLVMVHLGALAALGIAAAAILTTNPEPALQYSVLGGGLAGCVIILVTAVFRARATANAIEDHANDAVALAERRLDESTKHTQQWITDLRSTVEQGKTEFPQLVEQVRAGEHPAPRWPADEPAAGSHPFEQLSYEIRQAQAAAEFAVARMQQVSGAGFDAAAGTDPGVAVFANIARRVQSLAHRAIQRLDELEQQVEDPDLLKGLFAVDHLVTGMRRQAESLAVLGGSMPRRQWSRPVPMYTVLRSSVAEVEHYARVKVLPPVDGTLHGHAVADVIHLIAELVENATAFSEPDTQVTVSTQRVTAGLAIDIRDRGLGIEQGERATLNALLADPSAVDRDERLKDGRIGLYVVAQLSERHHVAVELENNMYGGTDAHVVIPSSLLGDEEEEPEQPPAAAESAPSTAAPTLATTPKRQPKPKLELETELQAEPLLEPTPSRAAVPALSGADTQTFATFNSFETFDRDRPSGRRGVHRAPRTEQHSLLGHLDVDPPAASNGASNGALNGAPYGRHTGVVPETAATREAPAQNTANSERPPLPRRDRSKTYVVPQLAGGPKNSDGPRGGPNPGLWAAYRKGIQGGTSDGDDPGDHSA
ncbi:sensor histidine kinase [Saccharopolyspora spinosa]|uniref:histidine kinase n=1 Tax=Saccharopolyspora spinosa TaxID=60894 RepID=A0A2N3XXZ1_SACSN|nr:ATP-binding protein [Saccharopolyspora spinosa]PKW15499.1 histidine kinase/DNA gyrase B/HSP90-like ATPase [Saccharopolyspora spinosa]